jgi:hypothetical protein
VAAGQPVGPPLPPSGGDDQHRLLGELQHHPGLAAHVGTAGTALDLAADHDQLSGPVPGLFQDQLGRFAVELDRLGLDASGPGQTLDAT